VNDYINEIVNALSGAVPKILVTTVVGLITVAISTITKRISTRKVQLKDRYMDLINVIRTADENEYLALEGLKEIYGNESSIQDLYFFTKHVKNFESFAEYRLYRNYFKISEDGSYLIPNFNISHRTQRFFIISGLAILQFLLIFTLQSFLPISLEMIFGSEQYWYLGLILSIIVYAFLIQSLLMSYTAIKKPIDQIKLIKKNVFDDPKSHFKPKIINDSADGIIKIREANNTDLKGIFELYEHLFTSEKYEIDHESKKKWHEILSHKGLSYFVIEKDNQIIASCNISIVPNLWRQKKSYALIENVITHPSFQRKGYGKILMEEVIAFAKKNDCYKIMLLSTANHNREAAHRFYTSLGFDGDQKRGFNMKLVEYK
jgi:ribosomal protein S18 acetylase RimI-like enzyme/uncharacterized integral membrane protein